VSCAAHDTNQSVDRIRTIGKGTYLVETLDVHRSREFGAQHSDDYQVSGISRFAYVLSPDQTRGGYTAGLYAKSGKLPARAALDLYLSSRRRQYLPPSPAEYTAMRKMGAECTDSSPKLVEEGFRTDTTATFFCRQHIVTVDFNSGNACFFDLTSWLPRTEARPVPASLPDISTIESIKPRQDSHVTLDSYLHIQSAGKSGVFVYMKPEVLRGRSETSIDRIAKWGGMG